LEEGELSLYPKDPSGEKIRVITSPGHSPGCVCFYLPGEKALISGDTIFQNSIGRTDLPGGDMEIMGKSVEKLASLKGIELLLPGHMDYISGAAAVDNNFTQIKRFFFS
jgi:hydroxyacylglutathione hydrolase